ncbi:MAG TPA: NAD(P)H-binding protein [Actinomycetota bacterium]|nr:NAD(P)H-binding protein [Actinomycetota bacterium]
MNLAVFGATGGTGRLLVARSLERGHSVTAFVRSGPAEESLPGVDRVVTGDARNPSAVRSALRGAEAVVSAMGPQAPEPGDVYSNAIGELTRAMASAGPRRLVISANSRVLDDLPLDGPYAAVSQEHRDALACLHVADLDWTVVATPMLADDEPRGGYQAVVDERGYGPSISRADFATALLDALDHPEWAGHVVDVSTAA